MPAVVSMKFLRRTICKGCLTHQAYLIHKDEMPDYPDCQIKPFDHGEKCPCLTCLVKPMCENECDKLTSYKKPQKMRIQV